MYRWHRSRGAPLRDEKGGVKRWAGYFSDIHDQKEAIENLTAEREIRERFVATLTHDLRNPLTAARMSAQLIFRKAGDPVSIQKSANRILDSVDRADHMIRDLLDANRIKAGERLPIETQDCELGAIASDTVDDLVSIHGDRFVLHANERIEGHWSPEAIRHILENLCNNAIKYGAAHVPVTVTIDRFEDRALIRVRNEGEGIPLEDQPTLFDPFRRTKSAQSSGQKGWGLGLTLVRGLAEAHGGGVSVESAPGKGAVFTVALPL